MTSRNLNAAVILAVVVASGGLGTPSIASGEDNSIPWSEMEKFFIPPEQYRGKLGDYRSLMNFDDGTPVKTPKDWPQRRQEILKHWHGVMGSWPELIGKPRIEYQEKEHVENFTRHRVEVEIALLSVTTFCTFSREFSSMQPAVWSIYSNELENVLCALVASSP